MSLLGALLATATAAMLGIFAGCWLGFRAARALAARHAAQLPAYENDREWLRARARRAGRRMAAKLSAELGKPHLETALREPFRRMILDEFRCSEGEERA